VVVEPKVAPGEVLRAAWGAAGAGFLAVIIYAGIIGGIFTATEASAVAVVYALVIGLFVYRQISFRELPEVVLAAAKTTATLSFVLATSALFGWTLGIGKVPELVTVSLIEGTEGMLEAVGGNLSPETSALLHKILILLVLNVVLLLIGTVLDVAPALLILVPVLLPVADAIGMGSGLAAVHFGIIVVTNLLIGVVTPPIGTTLFVAAAVGKVEVAEMIPDTNRLLVSMVIVQLIITYVPFITTFLPSLM
jgi:tripartite ATP-independent transporter DctM subunit